MGNEAMPEYIADQGMYYSAAAPNFHGYYCTGLESPCESDGHQRFFRLDGQDLHYLGMQTDGLPYVYYTPSYESAHSNYNHYSSCNIPSAVVGVDSQFVGTQQYFTNAAYEQPVSSPAFFPVVLQPGASFSANVAPEPFIYNPVASGAGENSGISVKLTPPAPVGLDSSVYLSDSVTRRPELCQMPSKQLHPSSNVQKGFQFDFKNVKQRASNETMASNGVSLVSQLQARDSTGSVQVSDQLKGNVPSVRSSLKVTAKAFNGSGQLGPHVLARASVDRVRPRLQSGIQNNATGSPAILGDQSKGPRMDRSKGPWTTFVVKAYTTKAGACNAQGNITIYPDQYNRGDFPVNYPDAKFFVIKSYSEDDVHKSIKYSVWSSTPSGNKRLDGAYEEVQRISGGKTGTCPVFLFFSVNGSGQFCGVAEMIGPVDFSRDMDFWQQDKWAGSFPVKWHIIKDVPNASFRHIILENNENKPVTNSRDTQQVKYMPGVNMLSIFKNSPLRASILDDFSYYEDRQRIMFEEKSRLFVRTCGTTGFLPAFAPNKPSVTIKHPLKTQEKAAEPEGNIKTSDIAVSVDDKITSRSLQNGEVNDKKPGTLGVAQDGSIDSVMKIGSLSVDLREGETDRQAASTVTAGTVEYVTVGSVPIKVDGSGASSLGDSTVGAIPTHPKAGKQKRLNGVSASSNTPVQEKAALQTT